MTILLFDAGGVLLELGPPPIKSQWIPEGQTLDTLWTDWISMSASRRFESGKTTAEQFADEMITTLNLQTDAQSFIEHFRAWPVEPFPGTRDWLVELSKHHHTAMLSNTNELHWRRMKDEMGLGDVMNDYFLSHKLGMVKPDVDIFEEVISQLDTQASNIAFFDDNQKNIEAANAIGMQGFHVQGAEELRAAVASIA